MNTYDRDNLESALKYLVNEYGLGVLAGNVSVIIRDFFDAGGHKGEVSLLSVMQKNDTLKNLVWLKESGKGSDECLRVMRLEVREATEAFIREDAAVRLVNMAGRVVGLGVSVEAGPTVTQEIDWRTQAKAATTKPSVMSDGDFLKLCKYGDARKVEAAIMNGAEVNTKDNDGWTALMWAARNGHTEIAELLLKHGAEVNAKNNDGETAFIYAVLRVNVDVAELLLRQGADINAKDCGGKTALHLAAEGGNVEAAQFLMRHGANKGLKDDKGRQPFYYTRYEDDEGYWAHNDVYGVLMLHNY